MNPGELVGPVDDWIGQGIESAMRAHHRRRLRRIGWEHALDSTVGWAGGDPPPRAGNALEVLVDGREALPRIAAAIAAAESHVHLAGWHFDPAFRLDGDISLRELLAETAERVDVRVLAWAGSPLPLFHPDRRDVRRAREQLVAGTRIACALDARERPLHCHHEKLVLVDGRLGFVGGIDLTELAGDRLDYSHHPARGALGWHDAAAALRGPALVDVGEHFRVRWQAVTGKVLPAPQRPDDAGDVEVQVVRTVPEHVYPALPRGDFRILETYLGALRSAERLIYLESQFLWSPEIVAVLADKLSRPLRDDFRLVVLLPARPNNGQDDTRGQIGQLANADGGGGRFLACTLFQRGTRTPVYVHAKIGIVDDRWLTLGSANLNEHSLFNDTEVNLVTHDAGLARATRLRLWAEHLELAEDEVAGDPSEVVDELWRPRAEEELERLRRGEPAQRRLCRLPHVSRRSRAFLGPLNGLLVDG